MITDPEPFSPPLNSLYFVSGVARCDVVAREHCRGGFRILADGGVRRGAGVGVHVLLVPLPLLHQPEQHLHLHPRGHHYLLRDAWQPIQPRIPARVRYDSGELHAAGARGNSGGAGGEVDLHRAREPGERGWDGDTAGLRGGREGAGAVSGVGGREGFAGDQSHVSYAYNNDGTIAFDGGDCPSTHPSRLVKIFIEVLFHAGDLNRYPFHANRDEPRFVLSTGDTMGLSFHVSLVFWAPYSAKAEDKISKETCIASKKKGMQLPRMIVQMRIQCGGLANNRNPDKTNCPCLL
ncbi:hypothetical protein DFJ73DRAFT_962190 [Zopfochytrium polystomum]|nr:hypothetical protein DFJ73DRAFT_962190 [Zopfochytrium polystomum]